MSFVSNALVNDKKEANLKVLKDLVIAPASDYGIIIT